MGCSCIEVTPYSGCLLCLAHSPVADSPALSFLMDRPSAFGSVRSSQAEEKEDWENAIQDDEPDGLFPRRPVKKHEYSSILTALIRNGDPPTTEPSSPSPAWTPLDTSDAPSHQLSQDLDAMSANLDGSSGQANGDGTSNGANVLSAKHVIRHIVSNELPAELRLEMVNHRRSTNPWWDVNKRKREKGQQGSKHFTQAGKNKRKKFFLMFSIKDLSSASRSSFIGEQRFARFGAMVSNFSGNSELRWIDLYLDVWTCGSTPPLLPGDNGL